MCGFFFFNLFPAACISCFCMLTEVVLGWRSGAELGINAAQTQTIDAHNRVPQLLSSPLISPLHFSRSLSPSYGLIVPRITQALCSPPVQKEISFPSPGSTSMQMLRWVGQREENRPGLHTALVRLLWFPPALLGISIVRFVFLSVCHKSSAKASQQSHL